MPKEGYKTITVSEDLYKVLERIMIEENYKAGYRRFRSLNDLLDHIVAEWAKNHGLLEKEETKGKGA